MLVYMFGNLIISQCEFNLHFAYIIIIMNDILIMCDTE